MELSRYAGRSARGPVVGKVVLTAVFCVMGVVMILPFLWMLSTAFKRPMDIYAFPIEWIPAQPQYSNFEKIWNNPSYPFYRFFVNSTSVAVFSVIGSLLLSSTAAYAFTKIEFKGRSAIFLMFLATMMIPQHITLVPRFILFKWLGIYDSHMALILPSMFNVLGIFLLRQFYLSVPMELSEAAKIDGAGHLRTWIQVVMPLTRTAMASLVILTFVWSWNDYINPIIFLTSKETYTIPIGLQVYKDNEEIQYNLIMAAASLAIIPIVALFLSMQKHFIEGIAASGIKG